MVQGTPWARAAHATLWPWLPRVALMTARGIWPWRFSARVLLASGAMAALVGLLQSLLVLPPDGASRLQRLALLPPVLGVAAAGGLAFLAALRLLGGLDAQDRLQLQQMRLPLKRWIFRVL